MRDKNMVKIELEFSYLFKYFKWGIKILLVSGIPVSHYPAGKSSSTVISGSSIHG